MGNAASYGGETVSKKASNPSPPTGKRPEPPPAPPKRHSGGMFSKPTTSTNLKTCRECYALHESKPICPYCGYINNRGRLKKQYFQFEQALQQIVDLPCERQDEVHYLAVTALKGSKQ